MVIHNPGLSVYLHDIFLNCARYLFCNGNATADGLQATLESAIQGGTIARIEGRLDDAYILRSSMDDLLHYFKEASLLMQAENEAFKKTMPKADGCE